MSEGADVLPDESPVLFLRGLLRLLSAPGSLIVGKETRICSLCRRSCAFLTHGALRAEDISLHDHRVPLHADLPEFLIRYGERLDKGRAYALQDRIGVCLLSSVNQGRGIRADRWTAHPACIVRHTAHLDVRTACCTRQG